ncbi:hypothetical protein CEB3_c46090 [Peptococcaceae bacterium CEB3]|nr:hypothetical protein CEB3_c46090 [Peptococcaceae bacterium CEB3]
MTGYIGYALPFSYVGPTLAFTAFAITILIITGLRDILNRGQIPW